MPIGTILFYTMRDPTSSYGFVVPDGSRDDDRANNLWFGRKAAGFKTFKSGDRVEFSEGNFRPGKGRSASHVKLIEAADDDNREKITYLGGDY
jgi:cold shock CspA family protein